MSPPTSAARASERSPTAGRCLISWIVPAVTARALMTLAWRRQKGSSPTEWMCLPHHQVPQS